MFRKENRSPSNDKLRHDFRVKYRRQLAGKSISDESLLSLNKKISRGKIITRTAIYEDLCIIIGAVMAVSLGLYVAYKAIMAELGHDFTD